MLHQLGLDLFGVWAVTGAMATYAGLLDLGITRSLARFIALYDVEDDRPAIRECVGLGLIAVSAVGAVGAVACRVTAPLFAAPWIRSARATCGSSCSARWRSSASRRTGGS